MSGDETEKRSWDQMVKATPDSYANSRQKYEQRWREWHHYILYMTHPALLKPYYSSIADSCISNVRNFCKQKEIPWSSFQQWLEEQAPEDDVEEGRDN